MKMSSNQITEHFKQKKGGRIAHTPKVHDGAGTSQAAVNKDLQILREFDLDWQYGPCTGLTHLERWERAAKHGLNPPQLVKDLITQHSSKTEYTENVWSDYCL